MKVGLTSSIPLVGAAAAELLGLVIAPSLERRRNTWMEEIGKGLTELEDRIDGFDLDTLAENEIFITTAIAAAAAALRTNREEKRFGLRNAVLNAALSHDLEESVQLLLVRHIDELTPVHLDVLQFFSDQSGWFGSHGIDDPKVNAVPSSVSRMTVAEVAFPELATGELRFDLLVRDLDSRGLLHPEAVRTKWIGTNPWMPLTSPLGNRLLAFITAPNPTT